MSDINGISRERVNEILLLVMITNGRTIEYGIRPGALRESKKVIVQETIQFKVMKSDSTGDLIIRLKELDSNAKTFIRYTGYEDSWNGGTEWASDFVFVKPIKKKVTIYEKETE